ncbi:MAG TPA: response regulator [Terracidiphilus sp.]|nr:response regulator [Terracidiphilus sp.]
MTQEIRSAKPARETVFIVDDDASICEGLSNLLESVGIAAEHFSSVEAFREGWRAGSAGCLLLDARLPGMSGVEFQDQMQSAGVDLPVIFMTAHGDMPMVRKVMKAGAIEFLIKPFQKEELLQAVEQAFATDRARRREGEILGSIRARIASLSQREREVMAMVIAGMLNKQIAADLNLSEITVKLHRRHIMEKMQAGSLAELVKLCERVSLASSQKNP